MTMQRPTVTVIKCGKQRFEAQYSQLPGQTFGPMELPEMVRDLQVAAFLSPMAARDLVLDAAAKGRSTAEIV